jgi:membrane fusion protein, multidrug efflux system
MKLPRSLNCRRVLFTGLFCLSACHAMAQVSTPAGAPVRSAAGASAPPLKPADATAPATASATDSVRVLLVADRETTLSSPVTARIKMLFVSIGVQFGAGQTLVSFDCEEPVARLGMANADLAGAVESHEAKVRMQGLEQASDVEVALAASAAAKARGQVELQQAQVAQCTLKAPWAGRVAKVHVRTHMSVTPGQPMVDLVKSGPLRLKLNAPSRMVGKVKPGSLFDVVIDETGKTYQARVLAVNSRVDPVSQTVEIEASIVRNFSELLPGMSGVASLNLLR